VALQNQEILLHNFLNEFLEAVRKDEWGKIEALFHPRAKRTKDIGDKMKAILQNRYDAPWQFSVFRVWRIKSSLRMDMKRSIWSGFRSWDRMNSAASCSLSLLTKAACMQRL
jgi:hypothetical protein